MSAEGAALWEDAGDWCRTFDAQFLHMIPIPASRLGLCPAGLKGQWRDFPVTVVPAVSHLVSREQE